MSELMVFNNVEFGEIRSMQIDGKIYFVGRDVASALGYSNPSKAVSTHCKHIRKETIDVSSQNGNAHKARYIKSFTTFYTSIHLKSKNDGISY